MEFFIRQIKKTTKIVESKLMLEADEASLFGGSGVQPLFRED